MKKITLLAMSLVMALTVKAQNGTDVTGQFVNADFETGSTEGWTVEGPANRQNLGVTNTAASNGYQGTYFMESWKPSDSSLSNFDWSQTQDMPNGIYVVKALGHAIMQGSDAVPEGVYLYAENQQTAVTTTSAAEYTVMAEVTDGTLTIGYRGQGFNANWVACDDFRIMQYTGATTGEALAKYAEDVLEELSENKFQQALADAMNASIASLKTAATWADAEALWAAFEAQVEEAKASTEAYAALFAMIEKAGAWVEMNLAEGTDAFEAALSQAADIYDNAPLNVEETKAATVALDNAIFDFFMLNADGELEYDMTGLHVKNPGVRTSNAEWTYNPDNVRAVNGNNLAEFFNVDYDMSQTIEGLPNGMYAVYVTGYYRASSNDNNVGFNAYENGTEVITAELYANQAAVKLTSLYKHSVEEVNAADPTDKTIGGWNNFANSMGDAQVCFDKGFYADNRVTVIVTDGKLTFGIRNKNHGGNSWTAFRDFKLGYLGNFPAVVLANALAEAQAWFDENGEALPLSAIYEYAEAYENAEPYSYVDSDYENEEVLAMLDQFEAQFASVKRVLALLEQLKEVMASVVDELLPLNYPGAAALQEAYNAALAYTENLEEFEVEEGKTTEQAYEAAIAALQEAITAYNQSQVGTPDNPADYTFLIPNPNFEEKGAWTWSVMGGGTDQWNGGCRPSEEGGASRQGVNLWGWGLTSVDVHQELTDLPNGLYKVSAELITQTNFATDQHVYATGVNTVTSEALTETGWDTYQWTELMTTACAVVVDGKLVIGAASSQGGQDSQGWFQATNFKLYYCGPASDADLKAAWDTSLARAQEMAATILPGDAQGMTDAIAAATKLAGEGKYGEACQALNPAMEASDSVYNAVVKFKEGNYKTLAELEVPDGSRSAKVFTYAYNQANALLAAKDATHAILDPLNEILGGYADYIAYLMEAEDIIATIKGVKKEYVTLVNEEIIPAQVADLVAALRSAADCADLLGKLRQAMQALQSFDNLKATVGDVTDLIVNATIDDDAATGWTIVKGTGNGPTNAGQHYDGSTGNRYLDSWSPSGLNFTAYQEIIGLPDGTYELVVATRSDGENAYVFASPERLAADTAQWTAAAEWAMVKRYADKYGEIWLADSLQWAAAEGAGSFPYFEANNAEGRGWSYDTVNVVVTNHYLAIGITANHLLTGKEAFTGSWIGADDWKLTLLEKAATQSDYNPFTGVENIEAVAPVRQGIYDLYGRRVETPAAGGIYIIDGKKVVIK